MNLIELAEQLTSEIHNLKVDNQHVVVNSKKFRNLAMVETAGYDAAFARLSPFIPEVTVAYGDNDEILKVFSVQQEVGSNFVSLVDSDDVEVVLNGGIDSEQFLYLCNHIFQKGEAKKIDVFRHESNLNLPKMWQPDPLFIKAALAAYDIDAEVAETDRLVVSTMQAFDPRPTGYLASREQCQRTGWCNRWKWGTNCIKGLGLCIGIPH